MLPSPMSREPMAMVDYILSPEERPAADWVDTWELGASFEEDRGPFLGAGLPRRGSSHLVRRSRGGWGRGAGRCRAGV